MPAYFDLQLDHIEVLEQNPEIMNFNLRIRKVNKVRSIIGKIIAFIPFDEKLICEIKGLKKQGNEYKYLPYRMPSTSICDDFILKSGKKIFLYFNPNLNFKN